MTEYTIRRGSNYLKSSVSLFRARMTADWTTNELAAIHFRDDALAQMTADQINRDEPGNTAAVVVPLSASSI
jgi:hypothetical protein